MDLSLPSAPRGISTPARSSPTTVVPDDSEPESIGIRVLVIENEELLLRQATRRLVQLGFDVVAVRTGRDGLAALSAALCDVVVLDLRLDDMHGTAWLRERQRLRLRTPVIVVTAYPDDLPAEEAARLNAHGPYPKPYAFDDLATLLVTAASTSRAASPPAVRDLLDLAYRLDHERPRKRDFTLQKTALLAALLRALCTPALDIRFVAACADGVKALHRVRPLQFPRVVPYVRARLAQAAVPRSQLDATLVRVLDLFDSAEARAAEIRRSAVALLLGVRDDDASRELTDRLGFHLPALRRARVLRDILPALLLTTEPIGNLAIDCGVNVKSSRFQHLVVATFGLSATELRALAQTVFAASR